MREAKRKFCHLSLKRRILMGLVLVGLLPFLVLGLFSLFRLDHAIRANSEKLSMALSDQIRDNFDHWLNNYEYESFDLAMQNAVQTYLSNSYFCHISIIIFTIKRNLRHPFKYFRF